MRQATRDDIPALAALKREVAAAAYGAGHAGPALDAWLEGHCGESYFAYRVGRKDYHVFVACDEQGEIVGVSGYRRRGDRADGSSVGLYVRESGRGVGSALHAAREAHARSIGCTRARVACWRTNERAREFVQARGYRPTGVGYREQTTGVRVDQFERDL